MAIFDIDKIINDPWAGLRETNTYINYVLEEAQRLLDCGELKMSSREVYMDFVMGGIPNFRLTTSFFFDGRKFIYLYYKSNFSIRCDEWEHLKNFTIRKGKIGRCPSF